MSTQKVYVGDYGTVITLDTKQSLAGATGLSIKVIKPNKDEVSWPGVAENSTWIRYVVQPGDLDQAGAWVLHAKVTTAAGSWTGDAAKTVDGNKLFRVYEIGT